jgi:hypothetical protein
MEERYSTRDIGTAKDALQALTPRTHWEYKVWRNRQALRQGDEGWRQG